MENATKVSEPGIEICWCMVTSAFSADARVSNKAYTYYGVHTQSSIRELELDTREKTSQSVISAAGALPAWSDRDVDIPSSFGYLMKCA